MESLTQITLIALGGDSASIGTDTDYALIEQASRNATALQCAQAIAAIEDWSRFCTAGQRESASLTIGWVYEGAF